MKRILTIALVVFCCIVSYAQDTIILRNANEIQAKVLLVGINDITYKKWDYQDGPSYQIAKQEVFCIKYANGTKEVFGQASSSPKETSTSNVSTKNRKLDEFFYAYLEGGCIFTTGEAGPMLNVTIGFHLSEQTFVGIQSGIEALFGSSAADVAGFDMASFPLMADFRALYPFKNAPAYFYMECALGATFLTRFGQGIFYQGQYYYIPTMAIFRFQPGLGFNYKRATISAGYSLFHIQKKNNVHCGYVKVGIRLGKLK